MIAYQEWGAGKGPTVVALHGWLDNSSSFLPLSEKLSDQLHIIALDLPGHGHSSHVKRVGVSHFLDWVFHLERALKELNIGRSLFLGHSMGASVAVLFASLFPESVRAVACLDGLAPFSEEPEVLHQRITDYWHQKKLLEQRPTRPFPDLETMIHVKQQAGEMSPASAKLLVERDYEKRNGGFYWRHDLLLKLPTAVRFTETQVLALLDHVQCPVLVLEASDGPFGKLTASAERKARVKNLETIMVKGNHYAHMDNVSEVAPLIKKFLLSPSGA